MKKVNKLGIKMRVGDGSLKDLENGWIDCANQKGSSIWQLMRLEASEVPINPKGLDVGTQIYMDIWMDVKLHSLLFQHSFTSTVIKEVKKVGLVLMRWIRILFQIVYQGSQNQ